MAIVVDKILNTPMLHTHVKIVDTDPASGQNGDLIINSTTGYMKVWYVSGWFTIGQVAVQNIVLNEAGGKVLAEDGSNILMEYNII